MEFSQDIITSFAKITNDTPKASNEMTLYGTIVIEDNHKYVRLDGSEILTPVDSTVAVVSGARVTVMMKNHTAIVTGNLSDPSASSADLLSMNGNFNTFYTDEFEQNIQEIDERLTEAETKLSKIPAADNVNSMDSRIVTLETSVNGGLTEANVKSMNISSSKFTMANKFITNNMVDTVSATKILMDDGVTVQVKIAALLTTIADLTARIETLENK